MWLHADYSLKAECHLDASNLLICPESNESSELSCSTDLWKFKLNSLVKCKLGRVLLILEYSPDESHKGPSSGLYSARTTEGVRYGGDTEASFYQLCPQLVAPSCDGTKTGVRFAGALGVDVNVDGRRLWVAGGAANDEGCARSGWARFGCARSGWARFG